MTSPERIACCWSQPLLPQAATLLCDHAQKNHSQLHGVIDLSQIGVLLPGRRAGRMLDEALLNVAASRNRQLLPPTIITPGTIASSLFPFARQQYEQATGRGASNTELHAAWIAAFDDLSPDGLAALGMHNPRFASINARIALAKRFNDIDRECSGAGATLDNINDYLLERDLFSEQDRWQAFAECREHVEKKLAESNLRHPDALAWDIARSEDAAQHIAVDRVYMIGVTELSPLHRALLQHLGDRLICIVHCDNIDDERFDELGLPRPEWWTSARLPLDEEHIIPCASVGDECNALLRTLPHDEQIQSTSITIGLAAPDAAPAVRRQLNWAGLPSHDATGTAWKHTAPGQLVSLLHNWHTTESLSAFASLVLHEDVARWLEHNVIDDNSAACASRLERAIETLREEKLVSSLRHPLPDSIDASHRECINAALQHVRNLLEPLNATSDKTKEQVAWYHAVPDIICAIYNVHPTRCVPRRVIDNAVGCLCDFAEQIGQLPVPLRLHAESDQGFSLTLSLLDETMVPDEAAASGAIDLLGWLELPLDPAPNLLLCGAVEGALPAPVAADDWLPPALRSAIGLRTDDARHGRDAYLLNCMLNARTFMRIGVPRANTDETTLLPSRLFFQGGQAADTKRLRHLFPDDDNAPPVPLPIGIADEQQLDHQTPRFVIPDIPERTAPAKLSVTSFASYLSCPYCFALNHILGLRTPNLQTDELNYMQFGTIMHNALDAYGKDSQWRDCDQAAAIEEQLHALLDVELQNEIADIERPAIVIQHARMRHRLSAFAHVQAAMVDEGWRIESCETTLSDDAILIVDDMPIRIKGRIDRIDRNINTDQQRVIDYKTGAAGTNPDKAHIKSAKDNPPVWINLQLPLYKHLLQATDVIGTNVELGYIVLPKTAEDTTFAAARWDDGKHQHAIETAHQVVRDIRNGNFQRSDTCQHRDFERICQTNVRDDDDDSSNDQDGEHT